MSNNIMLDLETLDNGPKSCILSIGAVIFDFSSGIKDKFYIPRIDTKSCVKAGLTINLDTILWWLKQDEGAKEILHMEGQDLKFSLQEYLKFATKWNVNQVWGNGSDFDNVIMRNAIIQSGLTPNWHFGMNRCFRTMKNLFKVDYTFDGIKHNALDDAINQTKHLILINDLYSLNLQ